VRDIDYSAASDFLAQFFSETTEHAVEIRALPNERGEGQSKPRFTRDPKIIEEHCAKWDQPDRAVYFGVATRLTGAPTGTRADLAELPALWVDIDCGKIGLEKDAVVAVLRTMPIAPSIIVDSGYGIHGYWLLREAIDIRQVADGTPVEGWEDTEAEIIAALKQLANALCGDTAVCDLPRIMRLPGTHNTKNGEMRLAHVLEATWARHEFSDIVEMLDWLRPLITRPAPPEGVSAAARTNGVVDDNPFAAFARQFGIYTPIDVQERLNQMTYLGDGDSGIHQTQLHVSASLVSHGEEEDTIVEILIEATKRAVGIQGANWNWKREERNIRRMIETAREKFVKDDDAAVTIKTETSDSPRMENQSVEEESGQSGVAQSGTTQTVNGGATVVSLSDARKKRDKSKVADDDKGPLIPKIGDAVIEAWCTLRGPIAVVAGEPYTYHDGIWHAWDKGTHHALKATIQGIIAAGKIDPKTNLLNAVYRYVLEHPDLLRENVEWDSSGLVVCQDGAIDPLTRTTCDHSERHWATTRAEIKISDMDQRCSQWLSFLDGCFSDLSASDRAAVIATIQEWFGAAMVRKKPRELRKALWLFGESRTGKTRIAEVLRLLVGDPVSSIKLRVLEKTFGGSALLGKRAWIVDDAIGSNDEVDDALFKVVVTGEAFSTDVKNKEFQTARLDIPVLFTSNSLPKVKDQSDAVFNRSLLIHMRVVRSEEETAGVKPIEEIVQENELAGVFSWALDGWTRVSARGRYNPPNPMLAASADFKASNNVVGSWVKECVTAASEYMIDRRDAYASFKGWYASEYGSGSRVPSPKFLIMSLRQCITMTDHKSTGNRYIVGIKLNDDGVIFRRNTIDEDGIGAGSGKGDSDVNQVAPSEALAKREPEPPQNTPQTPPRKGKTPRF
jgi:P4 family phage/plasmid primase-like protien